MEMCLLVSLEGICGQGLSFTLDGFRMLYLLVALAMWICTGVFSLEYMEEEHHRGRYYLSWLVTFFAVAGVFLSADLFTLFVFFELMSFVSFVWVIQEEKKESIHAGNLYLGISVIGSLVTLMGLFMLYAGVGNTFAAGCLTAVGFGAKAGVFLLHVWLPKAHTVAPAPASALLSGILTKTGIFGLLLLTGTLFSGEEYWGKLLLVFGILTMFTGAFLALFSVNFKRTLACSSVSQMGFILTGMSMYCLLDGNAGAYSGMLLHMLNHSLIKLVLFLVAGVLMMKTGTLDLNGLRGFGRNKPFLHAAFLAGAYSLAGIPLGSGYVSKTLIHESLVEYLEEISGTAFYPYAKTAEVLFLVTGGMTLAYLLKLYIAVFWERGEAETKPSCRRVSLAVILVPAFFLLACGLFPHQLMDRIAAFGRLTEAAVAGHAGGLGTADAVNAANAISTANAVNAAGLGNAAAGEKAAAAIREALGEVNYFAWENLKGAAISISVGLLVYFGLIRTLLMRRDGEKKVYVDCWPAWLDLEKNVYRPVLLAFLPFVCGFVCRVFDKLLDGLAIFMRRKVLYPKRKKLPAAIGTNVTYALGSFLDGVVALLNATVCRREPIRISFVNRLAIRETELAGTGRLIARSVSLSLLLFSIGLMVTLWYLLF